MNRHPIEPSAFSSKPFQLWSERWFLLCAGQNTPGRFNMMTVGWGGFGVMWGKPIAIVAVRPSRFTYSFMEAQPDFTLCAFPKALQEKLSFCGSKSGREVDKTAACGFTPIASSNVGAPGFEQAELILECRKIYFEDLAPARFLDPSIEENYGGANYHRLYTGEIMAVSGTAEYQA